MSRILHLDLSTGASGDKLLAALLEICERLELTTFEELVSTAEALLPEVRITRETVVRGGVSAGHITVEDTTLSGHNEHEDESQQQGQSTDSPGHHHHHHDHEHGHGHHHHHDYDLGNRHAHDSHHDHHHNSDHHSGNHTHHTHPQRCTWSDIKQLITEAALNKLISARTADLALSAFTRVAEAEAKVHGVTPDEVHFHEVGAADSIIDIVFNSFLLDKLDPVDVYATPLALGNGTFMCEHGELPVPAPATAEILAGSRAVVYASSYDGELTTPTGAALVAEFVTHFAPLPCSVPLATGYGAGSRQIEGTANVLRVMCAEPTPLAGLEASEEEGFYVEGIIQLECNLDHLSAEAIAFACEELLACGALDVWQESITMKKGRLASKLLLLSLPNQASELAKSVIELTGTLGVRSSYLERATISREVVTLETPYGPVPYKHAYLGAPDSQTEWLRPEHDVVARLARQHDLKYSQVYEELQSLAAAQRDISDVSCSG